MNVWALARHEDRLTEACNKLALVLVSNTPFYPLYLWFILGHEFRPWMLLSALSLPFFAATIWVARRNGLLGRVWLSVCASLNSGWVSWLLGPPAGVALFFLPCLMLAVLGFRATEFWARATLTVIPFGLYFVLLWMPHPSSFITQPEFAGLYRLNFFSVASLSVVLPYLLGDSRGGD